MFTPHAVGHDFNVEAINMSHIITHLSFGQTHSAILRKIKKKVPDLGGVYAVGDKSHEVEFVSQDDHAMHEHFVKVFMTFVLFSSSAYRNDGLCVAFVSQYIKRFQIRNLEQVVPRKYEPAHAKPIEFYEYTINSNSYSSSEGVVPSVKIQYDLSPMQVIFHPTLRNLCYRRKLNNVGRFPYNCRWLSRRRGVQ